VSDRVDLNGRNRTSSQSVAEIRMFRCEAVGREILSAEGSSNRASRGQRSGIAGRWRNLEPGVTIWTSFTRRRAAIEQHYVGLDVGLGETSLCIVDSEGKTVLEVKVSTEPAAIRSALEGYADRLSRIGVEASSLGLRLCPELQAKGCRSLSWKPVTCGCRCRRCATRPTATMRAALRR
jgi:hypothetical protein